ncbi:MAG: bifunctional glutamate N-acetyltransferase/amino-acid acetyltransferase ArgJ, partial [Actinobacteria bacterium]|nr:bifunctional glutamate N-acetyltransferase/amino-acid acetyltransferase ArgJ [Actinomycetota bacterium]
MATLPTTLDGFRVISGGLVAPRGFAGGGMVAGIKASGAKDLGAILSTVAPCTVAATFTQNRVRGASVEIDAQRVAKGHARAIVFNSGNANTFTGPDGHADALRMASAFAVKHGLPEEEVLVASTGVIGFRLPMAKVLSGIDALTLDSTTGIDIAEAMMTTDAGPKTVAVEVPLPAGTVRIGGAAKGAGMVHPNMGTMFAFLTTDATLDREMARRLFRTAVDASFNAISVDGDQSTSDSAMLLANGAAGAPGLADGSPAAATFARALIAVCQHLAREIVRGGEGVTKVFAMEVRGGPDAPSARRAARAVTTSLLVKTAVHGADPNWGRVVMALGNSGVAFDPATLDVWIGETQVVAQGRPTSYDARSVSQHLRGADCRIAADL